MARVLGLVRDLGNGFAEILEDVISYVWDIRELEKEMAREWTETFTKYMLEDTQNG